MFENDNDSSGLARWDSVDSTTEEYESVPEDIEFKVTLLCKHSGVDRFKYKLRKDKKLPASSVLVSKKNIST